MPEIELARRPDVELIRTGNWQAMSGSWNPTPDDLAAAVEAQSCPAIEKPIIKLGHIDKRFDGEPAMGYFENLRVTDGGHTLLGDQVTLPWLHSVQAAAYPSRSIEGNYNHTCSQGHKHKFVLTAVALLGVTPPAVKTIRRLNDLPAMLGVAASEIPDGAEHVQVTVLAGRHSFDESKHRRDRDGQFATKGGGGSEPGPVEASGPGLKRNERLAGRIPLADGETYVGSATIRSAGIALAAVDTPSGRTVRLGVGIDFDTAGAWVGANRGSTIVLDQDGMDQLREAIPQMLAAAKAGKARWRAMDKEYDRLEAAGNQEALDAHNDAMVEFGDFTVLDEGVIHGKWGDLKLRVVMSTGDPLFELKVQAEASPPVISDAMIEAPHLRRLAALLEKAGASKPVQASAIMAKALAEVHTGAMVALIPAAEDAERLAVDGGESANELHLTLAYLGEASDLGARGKQDAIDHVSSVLNGLPRLDAEIFSVNAFNPKGGERDTCLVWGVTGDMVDAVHDLVAETLHLIDAPIPAQHRPWAAHITAAYTDDLGRIVELAEKVGPILFDRVRLAFAGEFIDIPLMEWPGEEPEPSVAASAAEDIRSRILRLREARAAKEASVAASEPPADPLPEPDPPATILPAAEPEPVIQHEEDPVSLSDEMRSRLGLADDADEVAALAAIDALKTAAEKTPEPTPEMVQASAAAVEKAEAAEKEKDELRKEVQVLASQMKTVSDELAASKAEKFATVKASVIDGAVKAGKIKPADREQWETDYDEAPGAITRVLASIAVGTAVPVAASGVVGDAEPTGGEDDWDAIVARLDGPSAKAV